MTELIISSNTLHHMAFMLNATIWLDMHMLSSVQQDVSVAIPVNWITPKTVRKNPFMLSTTHFHSVIITCMECSIKVTICALVGFCHLYSKFKEHTGTIWHNVWREIHIKKLHTLMFYTFCCQFISSFLHYTTRRPVLPWHPVASGASCQPGAHASHDIGVLSLHDLTHDLWHATHSDNVINLCNWYTEKPRYYYYY